MEVDLETFSFLNRAYKLGIKDLRMNAKWGKAGM